MVINLLWRYSEICVSSVCDLRCLYDIRNGLINFC
jgi:hypothetical protein